MKGKLKSINNLLHKFSLDLSKYDPRNSESYQLLTILENYEIDTVIDVGAYDGGYANYLRDLGYEGKIISFEPLKKPHNKLKAKSKSDPNWQIAPRMAIGSNDGEIEINVSSRGYSSSILSMTSLHEKAAPGSEYIDTETVKINRLDTLIDDILPDNFDQIFLKIDVQGYEHEVIKGAKKLIEKIRGVQSEISIVPLYENQILYKEFISIMQSNDFNLHAIFPGFMDKKNGQLLQFDGVFIKNI